MRPCPGCGSTQIKTERQVFANKTVHLRRTCSECKMFLGYAPQGNKSFKDDLLFLVKDLASAGANQFDSLKVRAEKLMKQIPDITTNQPGDIDERNHTGQHS